MSDLSDTCAADLTVKQAFSRAQIQGDAGQTQRAVCLNPHVVAMVCWRRLLAGMLIVWLGGCANDDLVQRTDDMARSAGLQRVQVRTDSFLLTGYYRITRLDQPLTVYIEGDGFAWRSRSQPSLDPTPRKALGLALATVDPAPNLLYLARPCQFTPMSANPRCSADYWTGKRYAEEVVAAMNQAVGQYATRLPGQPLHLVGYSGGGAIAVLIAARRTDVTTLRTVAGNLDMDEVNRLHQVSAMPGSLNAIDFAPQVATVAQIHYSGSDDDVVPPIIARRYARATAGHCTQIRTVHGMSHESDWSAMWPKLLAYAPDCR
jgi:hypothetical protein